MSSPPAQASLRCPLPPASHFPGWAFASPEASGPTGSPRHGPALLPLRQGGWRAGGLAPPPSPPQLTQVSGDLPPPGTDGNRGSRSPCVHSPHTPLGILVCGRSTYLTHHPLAHGGRQAYSSPLGDVGGTTRCHFPLLLSFPFSTTSVCLNCRKKYPRRGFQQRTFIASHFGRSQVQDQGVVQGGFFRGPGPWLVGGHLHAVPHAVRALCAGLRPTRSLQGTRPYR